MGRLIYDETNGYQFVSDNGVLYDLLEGKSLKGATTSDIVFVMFNYRDYDDYAENPDDLFVGFFYGADFVKERVYDDENISFLDYLTEEYEKKNPNVIQKNGMLNKIKETVKAYYETNEDVLDAYQKYDLKQQIKFLEQI